MSSAEICSPQAKVVYTDDATATSWTSYDSRKITAADSLRTNEAHQYLRQSKKYVLQ